MDLPYSCCGIVFDLVSVDLQAQLRRRECRDIGAIETQGQLFRFQVVPNDQVPPEASQVLDGLGRQLLLP